MADSSVAHRRSALLKADPGRLTTSHQFPVELEQRGTGPVLAAIVIDGPAHHYQLIARGHRHPDVDRQAAE